MAVVDEGLISRSAKVAEEVGYHTGDFVATMRSSFGTRPDYFHHGVGFFENFIPQGISRNISLGTFWYIAPGVVFFSRPPFDGDQTTFQSQESGFITKNVEGRRNLYIIKTIGRLPYHVDIFTNDGKDSTYPVSTHPVYFVCNAPSGYDSGGRDYVLDGHWNLVRAILDQWLIS